MSFVVLEPTLNVPAEIDPAPCASTARPSALEGLDQTQRKWANVLDRLVAKECTVTALYEDGEAERLLWIALRNAVTLRVRVRNLAENVARLSEALRSANATPDKLCEWYHDLEPLLGLNGFQVDPDVCDASAEDAELVAALRFACGVLDFGGVDQGHADRIKYLVNLQRHLCDREDEPAARHLVPYVGDANAEDLAVALVTLYVECKWLLMHPGQLCEQLVALATEPVLQGTDLDECLLVMDPVVNGLLVGGAAEFEQQLDAAEPSLDALCRSVRLVEKAQEWAAALAFVAIARWVFGDGSEASAFTDDLRTRWSARGASAEDLHALVPQVMHHDRLGFVYTFEPFDDEYESGEEGELYEDKSSGYTWYFDEQSRAWNSYTRSTQEDALRSILNTLNSFRGVLK